MLVHFSMQVLTKKKLIAALIVFSILGGFLLLYSFNPSTNTFFLPCPFHHLTGLNCPGCGSQRALHHLFHLEFLTAFKYNPLMVLTMPLVIYALGVTFYNFIFGTNHRLKLFYNNWFIWGFLIITVIFWILRNVPYFPFNLLAPT